MFKNLDPSGITSIFLLFAIVAFILDLLRDGSSSIFKWQANAKLEDTLASTFLLGVYFGFGRAARRILTPLKSSKKINIFDLWPKNPEVRRALRVQVVAVGVSNASTPCRPASSHVASRPFSSPPPSLSPSRGGARVADRIYAPSAWSALHIFFRFSN